MLTRAMNAHRSGGKAAKKKRPVKRGSKQVVRLPPVADPKTL